MNPPQELITCLQDMDNFVIASHVFPDGDTLGASLALGEALRLIGKKAVSYCIDGVPESLRFLPGNEKVARTLDGLGGNGSLSDAILILMDCNSPDRVGIDGASFKKSIVVDHHLTEKPFGDIRWVAPDIAATGLMAYTLIKALGVELTRDMAMNIYTALAVDTGTFRYSNTTGWALAVAAELVEKGVQPSFVADRLYNDWSQEKFLLMNEMLHSLVIRDGVAIASITLDMFNRTGARPDDTENFVNIPIMVKSIRMSALFRQVGARQWKASLRSRGDVNVAAIAQAFDGGGHKNAAGYKAEGELGEVKARLLEALGTVAV